MKRTILPLIALLLSGCAAAQLKEKQARLEECHVEQGKLRVEARDLKARLSSLEDAESRGAELAARLQAAESRITDLEKANRDLSSSSSFSQSQLRGRVRELVVEKDELSKKLAESQKNSAVTQRKLTLAGSAKDRAERELSALKKEKADAEAAARLAAETEARDKSAREAAQREEEGLLVDALLKEVQAEQASVASNGDDIIVMLGTALLFESQEADLTESGTALLQRLAKAVGNGRGVLVESHSDAAALRRKLLGGFKTHLDLTSAQASAVARQLAVAGPLPEAASTGRGQSSSGNRILIRLTRK